jgi:hypothetical protein
VSATIIKQHEIEDNHIETLGELLANEISIFYGNYGLGLKSSFISLRGAAAAIYGTGSFGGVINVITKKADYKIPLVSGNFFMGVLIHAQQILQEIIVLIHYFLTLFFSLEKHLYVRNEQNFLLPQLTNFKIKITLLCVEKI